MLRLGPCEVPSKTVGIDLGPPHPMSGPLGVSGYGTYPACPLDGQADGRHRRSPRYSQRIGIEGMDSRPIEVCF